MAEIIAQTQQQAAEAWGAKTLASFRTRYMKLGIGDTGEGYKSLQEVAKIFMSADGDLKQIELAYKWYLTFVDMGVGPGVTLSDVGEDRRQNRQALELKNARQPKKWKGPVEVAAFHELSELMMKQFGINKLKLTDENNLFASATLET